MDEAYGRIFSYADEHGFCLGASAVERDVVDDFTAARPEDYVTEINVILTDHIHVHSKSTPAEA